MYSIEEIIDLVIAQHPKSYEQAKYDPAHIGNLRNACVQMSNRQITPLVFSNAIARRIERDLEREEREQNGN